MRIVFRNFTETEKSLRRFSGCLYCVCICLVPAVQTQAAQTKIPNTKSVELHYAKAFEFLEFNHELYRTKGYQKYLEEPIEKTHGNVLTRKEFMRERMVVPRDTYIELVRNSKRHPELRALGLRLLPPNDRRLDSNLMRSLLESENRTLQLEAIRTLGFSSSTEFGDILRSIAGDEKFEPSLRGEAVASLGAHVSGSSKTRQLLVRLAQSKDRTLQRESLRSLRGIASQDPETRNALLRMERGLNIVSNSDSADNELAEQIDFALGKDLKKKNVKAERQRPGSTAKWIQRLRKGGDPVAGRRVFFHSRGPSCSVCHSVRGRGGRVASNLSWIGLRMSREKIIESIVEPSRTIPPNYMTWSFAMKSGKIHTGLIMEETINRVILGRQDGTYFELKTNAIDKRVRQSVSSMPSNLTDRLTIEEFRDLIAFLVSCS